MVLYKIGIARFKILRAASQLNLRVARLIGKGVRNQKCEVPLGHLVFGS
jgi:hypothetical protein